MVNKKRKIRFVIFFVLFLIIGPLVVFYANGDIFNGSGFLKTGGIFVQSAPIGSNIYLNSKLKSTTSFFERDIFIKNLKPGTYEIKATKDGYNKWTKKIVVSNNVVSDANIFIIPEKVELKEIVEKLIDTNISTTSTSSKKSLVNQEYIDLSNSFSNKKIILPKDNIAIASSSIKNLGTKESPIMNGKEGIWKDSGKVYVGWFGKENSEPQYLCRGLDCKESMLVFDLSKSPTNLGFLPGYYGVIIVAFENQVFAVQLEENPDKGIQPIYKGNKPDFRIINGTVYIKDGSYIAEVVL